jgi:ABC-type dipeptide/oligopeptide/nickel transport system permease component
MMMHAIPGGPFDQTQMPLSPETVAKIMEMYGLDKPLHIQYLRYMWNAFHLRFGKSYQSPGEEIVDLIKRTLRISAFLGGLGLAFGLSIGLILGIISAMKPNSIIDYLCTLIASYTISVPVYVSSIFLMYIFALGLHCFPTGGFSFSEPKTWVMPIIAYSLFPLGTIARYTRSSLLDVLNEPYIVTAKSKGLTYWQVLIRHALKNALLPTITIIGMNMGWLFGGLIVVETLFGFPGMGSLLMTAIKTRDVPLIEACVLLITVIFSVSTMTTDIMYSYLNPRVRYQGGQK